MNSHIRLESINILEPVMHSHIRLESNNILEHSHEFTHQAGEK